MIRTFQYIVSREEEGLTVEWFLRSKGCSHHILTGLKKTKEGILKNGVWTWTNVRLEAGDIVTIHLEDPESSENIDPIYVPFRVTFEDDDILVVEKNADTPIHPSFGNRDNTLANGIAWYYQQKGEPFVYRCINRLDRDTSGLVLLAKHSLSAAVLSQAMVKREIHRTYLALVKGVTQESGTVDAPIARKDASVIERQVNFETGERAVTHYRRISTFRVPAVGDCSLLELHLDTGRTHQIRVHMTYLGHPLLGDSLYHPEDPSGLSRQALHSYSLDFIHPITGEVQHFVAELPEDLKALIPNESRLI